MLSQDALDDALQRIMDAALIGDGWPAALEALARAGGSRGVVIMHNRDRKLVSAIGNEAIREPLAAYLAGKAPPNARQTRVSHHAQPGFRIDFDDFTTQDIARDAYYQDFLRPVGLGWHANARLSLSGIDEVAVGFKRDLTPGSYESDDVRQLDQILPSLRVAARLVECVFDAEVRGMVHALHRRDRPVLEFDALGHVRRQHGHIEAAGETLRVVRGRAMTTDRLAQPRLEAALDRALRGLRQPSAVLLHDAAGQRQIFQIVPVLGRARDVFHASSAIGVLVPQPRRATHVIDQALAIGLYGLTAREAQIAALFCVGQSLADVARELRIGTETVRYHLKSIFAKTGVRRQAELVALLAALR